MPSPPLRWKMKVKCVSFAPPIIVDRKEEWVELLANSPNGFVRVAKVKGSGSIESTVLRGLTLDVGKFVTHLHESLRNGIL